MAKKSTNVTLTETPFTVVFFFSKFLQIAEKILQMVIFTPPPPLKKWILHHVPFPYKFQI